MDGDQNNLFGEAPGLSSGKGTSVKELVSKYLSYWPLFALSLIICGGSAIFYLRYTVPKYVATTLIMVKGDQSKGRTSEDLIAKALNGERKDNLENEFQMIRSRGLMTRVVENNQFNISYYKAGSVINTDLYLDVPFYLVPKEIVDSSSLAVSLKDLDEQGFTVQSGSGDKAKNVQIKWNTPFMIEGKRFVVVPRAKAFQKNDIYIAAWSPVSQTVDEILDKFSVALLDKNSSIIKMDITIENLKRGRDILDAIAKEFNLADIEDKNAVSGRTIRFIDDRISIVSRELNGVEGTLENYQGNNQIINAATQSSQSFENSNITSNGLTDVNVQQGVVEMIQGYFNGSGNEGKLVPSSLGINDATLSSMISKYNELQLKKEREEPLLAPGSPLLKDINNQINGLKGSILENLQNITKNLKLQENSLLQKNSQYRQFLTSLPHKERVMQEIKRKQSITEGLYLYLLQKREEASISASSSNISIYRQIDPAVGYGPVEPNGKNIWIYSILLGLVLPVGIVSLLDLLNDKITRRSDITTRVNIPIVGEIGHISKHKTKGIVVMNRSVVGEQFRIIRTNILSLLKEKKKQVFLITSSSVNEGKSFISTNLAAVLAIPGKKVALLEFDMRNPNIWKDLNLNHSKGISDYLTRQTNDLSAICEPLAELPALHVFAAGSPSPNPADLLLSDNMPKFFESLRQQYDYIVIDSSPAGLVSDAFILGQYSDAVLYVVRQKQTLKKQISFINDISITKNLNNMSIVVNDVRSDGKSDYAYGLDYNFKYEEEDGRSWLKKIVSFSK